ncbi:MAG: YqgE/AlgH family protein [Defluviicoccus sp.]
MMLMRTAVRSVLAVLITLAITASWRPAGATGTLLTGQLLVASPRIGDPRFAETVIYVVAHSDEGAMGLVVNRTYGNGPLQGLLAGFGIASAVQPATVRLQYGGPVEIKRGFVLHSADYTGPSTTPVGSGMAFSTGRDVLQAVADGRGPQRRLFILGYAGWGPGQLEAELAGNDWLTAPAETSLIFSDDIESVWQRALQRAGTPL